MKSMQVTEFGKPLQQMDSPTPEPQGSEVLLRVSAAGVCHTDLHLWHGGYDLGNGRMLSLKERGVSLPLTMGHETVGIVVATGPQATSVKVGDVRLIFPWIGCGQCDACKSERENYCLKPRTIGINRPGGYADHVLVPDEKYLVSLKGLPAVNAAPLACSGLTCFSALRKFGTDTLKRVPLVIFGAGGLGLMAVKLLNALDGAGSVVLDPDAAKRQAALQAGARAAIDPMATDAADQVRQATGGTVQCVLDFVSNPATSTLAFDLLTKGGHLVCVGLFGGAASWPLPLLAIKALTIQGSYVGSLPELRELVDLVAQKNLRELVPVSTCTMQGLGKALDDLENGRVVGRMIMTPETA
jgi:D-arabinose 1-dehydrogenase-like Zn-dependent alcohol dehydrogenase